LLKKILWGEKQKNSYNILPILSPSPPLQEQQQQQTGVMSFSILFINPFLSRCSFIKKVGPFLTLDSTLDDNQLHFKEDQLNN